MKTNKKGTFSSAILIFYISILFITIVTGCSSSKSGSNPAASIKEPVFGLYNKVSLGMTKEQVDSTLGVTPTPDKSGYNIKGMYNYMGENGKYGVLVTYNDKNQAYSKTVIYDNPAVLAPYCSKAITEKQADRIKNGMAYQEVTDILGGEGVECTIGGLPNDYSHPAIIRRWVNRDGSLIQVVCSGEGKVSNALFNDAD